jgi:hypothetical protein
MDAFSYFFWWGGLTWIWRDYRCWHQSENTECSVAMLFLTYESIFWSVSLCDVWMYAFFFWCSWMWRDYRCWHQSENTECSVAMLFLTYESIFWSILCSCLFTVGGRVRHGCRHRNENASLDSKCSLAVYISSHAVFYTSIYDTGSTCISISLLD